MLKKKLRLGVKTNLHCNSAHHSGGGDFHNNNEHAISQKIQAEKNRVWRENRVLLRSMVTLHFKPKGVAIYNASL
jgi:hypothetical protein